MKHKILFIYSLLIGLIMLFPLEHASAQGGIISEESINVSPYEQFEIDITAKGLENLGAIDLEILVNAQCFEFKKANSPNLPSISINNTVENGFIKIRLSGINTGALPSSFPLLKLCLEVKPNAPTGEQPILLSLSRAATATAQIITPSIENGSITINPLSQNPDISLYSKLSSNEISQGEKVNFTIYSYSTKGLAAGKFTFTYDQELFENPEIDAMKIGDNAMPSINTSQSGKCIISFASSTGIPSGDLISLSLTAKENINAETSLDFIATNMYNLDRIPIENISLSKKVALKETVEEPKLPSFSIKAPDSITNIDPFKLTVVLGENSNVAAGDFEISYNTRELSCLNVSSILKTSGAQIEFKEDFQNGKINFTLVNTAGFEEEAELLELEFKVKDVETTNSELTSKGVGVVDKKYEAVELEYESSALTIIDKTLLLADVNQDGYVNASDANIVQNAANYNKKVEEADNKRTDINGDGYVNASDLNLLMNKKYYNKSIAMD